MHGFAKPSATPASTHISLGVPKLVVDATMMPSQRVFAATSFSRIA